MNNSYAIVNTATRLVERLLPLEPEAAPPDHEVVTLVAPVRAWPAGDGDLHCSPGGELYFVDPRPLSELKTAKGLEINEARLHANRSGFVFAGKLIASDELSRSDIDAVQSIVARAQTLPTGWPGAWKAVDNTYVPISDLATWDAFYTAMYQTGLSNFTRAQALKARIAAATTAAEVQAITWETELTGGD